MEQLIGKAAEQAKQVMAGVQPSQFEASTPCSEFNVKELANHMAGLLVGSERAARKQERLAADGPMPDIIGQDPGLVYKELADKAVAAWKTPGSLDGMTHFGPGEMPAQMAGAITLMEIAVHAWDLAAATGQAYRLDSAVADATYETVKQLTGSRQEGGPFGPEVKIASGASVQDRLLALSGRNPAWKA